MSEKPSDIIGQFKPPYDAEAERGFVGSLLAWPKYFDDLRQPVYVDCVYDYRFKIIYQAMLDLRDVGDVIDPVTVSDRLKEKGHWSRLSSEFDLQAMALDYPTGALSQRYADIIVANWKRRTLSYAAIDVLNSAQSYDDPEDIQAALERRLDLIAEQRSECVIHKLGDAVDRVVERTKKMISEGRNSVGISTGFEGLDALTSGLVAGEFVVIGGRPSQGKTAFASNVMLNASEHAPVALVSIEMDVDEISQRILSSVGDINTVQLRHARLNESELDRMHTARAKLKDSPVWVVDIPNATLPEICQVVRQIKRKQQKLAAVFVDYLQLIKPLNPTAKRNDHVADCSGRLKSLARTLKICVVGLSQLNRESEGRKVQRPEMADLRESGAVEQDADVVALIHRTEVHDPTKRRGEADLIVCKVRNGPIGEVKLLFDKRTTTFKNAPPQSVQEEWPCDN